MHTLIIPQKMSGTGNVHDLASQHWDREIHFAEGMNYAVVKAAFYENHEYTTHSTLDEARDASYSIREYSNKIIDRYGNKVW